MKTTIRYSRPGNTAFNLGLRVQDSVWGLVGLRVYFEHLGIIIAKGSRSMGFSLKSLGLGFMIQFRVP